MKAIAMKFFNPHYCCSLKGETSLSSRKISYTESSCSCIMCHGPEKEFQILMRMVAETEANATMPFYQERSKTKTLQRRYCKFNFFMWLTFTKQIDRYLFK